MKPARYSVKVRDPRLILEAATFAKEVAPDVTKLGGYPGDSVRRIVGDAVLYAYRLRCGGVEVRDVASGGAA